MKFYRTEESDDGAEKHRLDEPQQFSDGPRAQLARELANYWKTDSRPEALLEEIARMEAGSRGYLANQLRNSHLTDSEELNRTDDALSHLNPRDRLAIATLDMWKGSQ